MEFKTQICTTKEQSKRLTALGLKYETADMAYEYKPKHLADTDIDKDWVIVAHSPCGTDIPAWSLHRLIEMCNKTQFGMTIGIYNDEVTLDGDLFEVYDNTYDNLISIIRWLIGLNMFNQEYLE